MNQTTQESAGSIAMNKRAYEKTGQCFGPFFHRGLVDRKPTGLTDYWLGWPVPEGVVPVVPVSAPGVALEVSGEVMPPAPAEPGAAGSVMVVPLSVPAVPGVVAGSVPVSAGGVVAALPAAVSAGGAAVVPVVSPAPVSVSWPQAARVREASNAARSAEYFFMCISSQKSLL